jgi:hypothetical protein
MAGFALPERTADLFSLLRTVCASESVMVLSLRGEMMRCRRKRFVTLKECSSWIWGRGFCWCFEEKENMERF